jgi:hypothetical protein
LPAPPIRGWGVGTGPDFKKEKMQKRNRELDLTAWLMKQSDSNPSPNFQNFGITGKNTGKT